MKLYESINRSFNLLAVTIVGLSGFAFVAEIFLEHDWPDKLDDIAILVLGITAIVWYLSKNNRYKRSIAPVIFVVLSLAVKIGAVIIEFADAEAAGDDFGAVTLFVLATIFIIYEYRVTKKLLSEAGTS